MTHTHVVRSKLHVTKEAYLKVIASKRWCEYGLPNFPSQYNGTVDLAQISHRITGVSYDDNLNSLVIQFIILDTYQGRLIQSLMDRGFSFESKFQALGQIDLTTNTVTDITSMCFIFQPTTLVQSDTVGSSTLQHLLQGFYG